MTRLQTLEGEGLLERLKRLRSEVDALKLTPQQIGASNIVSKEYGLGGNDWSIIDGLAPFQIKKYRVNFIYDEPVGAYADLSTDHVFTGDGSQFSKFEVYDDPANLNDPTKKSWIVQVAEEWGANNAGFRLKTWVRSAASGHITIQAGV